MKQDDRFFTIAGCCALVVTLAAFLWFNQGQIFHRQASSRGSQVNADAPERESPTTTSSAESRLEVQVGEPQPQVEPPNAVIRARFEPDSEAAPKIADSELSGGLRSMIETVAKGGTPQIEDMALPAPSEVLVRRDSDGRLVVAAGTHRRYEALVAAANRLNRDQVAAFLENLKLGSSEEDQGTADELGRLRQAVDHLLEVELPEVEPDMCSKGSSWGFVDDEYEQLSSAQKHLLLMGRGNASTLRSVLVEIRDVIGEPEVEFVPTPDPVAPGEFLVAEIDETDSSEDEITAR
jgi:hypothetical protein